MEKSIWLLIILIIFSVIFSSMPTKVSTNSFGVELNNVHLKLYSDENKNLYWDFKAKKVIHNPNTENTELFENQDGGRWVKDNSGWKKEALLKTRNLDIDRENNIKTKEAEIYLIEHCAEIILSGEEIIINNDGFKAPNARIDSPYLTGEVLDLHMNFNFEILESSEDSNIGWNIDSNEKCENGQRIMTNSHFKD